MKLSAVLLVALSANVSCAFSPPQLSTNVVKSSHLSAATLEAPAAAAEIATTNAPVTTDMGVEKDWAVDIVKDSDRVQP